MKTTGGIALLLAGLCLAPAEAAQQTRITHVLESSDLYWVPTIDQAVEMAAATGKPIFSMGYSLVPDGTTYTRKGDTCPKSVF